MWPGSLTAAALVLFGTPRFPLQRGGTGRLRGRPDRAEWPLEDLSWAGELIEQNLNRIKVVQWDLDNLNFTF